MDPDKGRTKTLLLLMLVTAYEAHTFAAEVINIGIDPQTEEDSVPVPASFMGFSMEPVSSISYMAGDTVFTQLVNNLVAYNTGPINIRWGGHTQDDSPEAITEEDWSAMAGLREDVSGQLVTYTLPINFRTSNISQAVATIKTAKDVLPGDAVYAIGLGNEPDAYASRHKNEGWKVGFMKEEYFKRYENYMTAIAKELTSDWTSTKQLFAGPDLADRNALKADHVATFAALGSKAEGHKLVKLFTWHYYVHNAKDVAMNKPFTVKDLLSQDAAVKVREHVLQYTRAARHADIGFRLHETNSLSHSGLYGVSNTMAAALWLIDLAFSVLQARAVGLNVHTAGCSPYSPVLFPGACKDPSVVDQADKFERMCPNICTNDGLHPALVNAPYYGMWFVNKALRNSANVTLLGDAALEGNDDMSKFRMYALRTERQMRIIILNVQDQDTSDVLLNIRLPETDKYGIATVTRLLHKDNSLSGTALDMTLAGQNIDPKSGAVQGNHTTCKLLPKQSDSDTQYLISMQPASAAVVVIPMGQGRRSDVQTLLTGGVPQEELCDGPL